MRQIILKKLKEIENTYNVKVLFAVESGSRAWGFASKDSDYDVRFVYKRNKDDYLHLNNERDVIEFQLDETLDINGWDLDKTLKLIHSSNPTILEWVHSPIIYYKTSDYDLIKDLCNHYFNERKCYLHYLHMSLSNYETYLLSPYVKMKKYFYALRPLFCAMYIQEYHVAPPIAFETLLDVICPDQYKKTISTMIMIKKNMIESDEYPQNKELNNYIETNVNNMLNSEDLNDNKKNWDELNKAFLQLLE